MDYMFDNMQIHFENVKDNRKWMKYRLLLYLALLNQMENSIKPLEECTMISDKKGYVAAFWNKESDWEQKIFGIMKKWEARHPITGILLCTILGGILISLAAGIVLEAIMTVI